MNQEFDLTIIIVNFNGWHWLKQTLQTLKKHYLDKSAKKIKVVVVDNGSTDDSVQKIAQFKWLEVIYLPKNLGFAAGNNVALKQVASDYVLLLNSDMELDERSNFDHLIEYLNHHPQVGVITPQVILPTGELDWACHRGEPTPWASASYFLGLEKMFPRWPIFARYHLRFLDLNQPHQIEACSGAAMLVRSTLLSKVGLLDERFFMYAEDLDWCYRIRAVGYQIIYHPAVTIIHHKNKSGLKSQEKTTRRRVNHHFYSTMLSYYDKQYGKMYPGFVRQLIKLFIRIKKGVS